MRPKQPLTCRSGRVLHRRILVLFVFTATTALFPRFGLAADFRPPADRLWDVGELNRMTLPPAVPDGNIVYLPTSAYYKLRALIPYRTYPVYHPDFEPKGYMEQL